MAAAAVTLEGLDKVVMELRKRGMDVRAGLEVICNAGADVILADAKARAPDYVAETLGKRTRSKSATKVTVYIEPQRRKKFAVWAEYGTKPHTIQPKRKARASKQALAIPGIGVFRRVRHPGAKKTPFLRPAFTAQADHAQEAMGRETKRVIRA